MFSLSCLSPSPFQFVFRAIGPWIWFASAIGVPPCTPTLPPLLFSAMLPQIFMPMANSHEAPQFTRDPSGFDTFFKDVEELAKRCNLSEAEKIRWACRYAGAESKSLSSSRLSSTTFARLFLYFTKSNSSLTLVDLIFLLILSIHVTLILSYPYIFTFILTHSLSFFQICWLLIGRHLGTSRRLSIRNEEDDLPWPTRRRPGYQPTRRATPGSPPR